MAEDWHDKLAKKTGYKPADTDSQQKHHINAKENKVDTIQFYEVYEGVRRIVPKLLDDDAKEKAGDFINPQKYDKNGKLNPPLKTSQLRRFHTDVRALEAKIKADVNLHGEQIFTKWLPQIKMIKSKVAYACPTNRKNRKVPEEFRKYLEEMINSINKYDDFIAFSLCFEAVVGYFIGEGGRDD